MAGDREQKLMRYYELAKESGDKERQVKALREIKSMRTAAPEAQPQAATEPSESVDLPEFNTVSGNEALFGGQFGNDDTGFGQILRDAGASLVVMDQKARRDGIRKRFPELEVQDIGEDNAIIRNPKTGKAAVLNREGLSMSDVSPFLSMALPGLGGAKVVQGAGSFGAKAAAGVATAATADAAYQGAEKLQGGEQGYNPARTAVSAATGGVLAPIPAVASKIAEKSGVAKLFRDAAPTGDALKSKARGLYQEIDDAGVTLNEKFTSTLGASLRSAAKKEGFHPKIQPKVAAALDEVNAVAGAPIKLGDLDNLRKIMQTAAASSEPAERRLASMMIERIDDAVETISPTSALSGATDDIASKYKEARGLWGRAKKSEMLTEAFDKAQNQASGFENGLRVQFRSILNNKKKLRGFNDDEIAAMRKVVHGGKAENALKALGKFGFTEGQATSMLLGSMGTAAGAAVGGWPGAVAVPLVGQISKNLAQKLTRNNAQFADDVIRSGKSGAQIVQAYYRATPKAQRSAEELSELLLTRGVDVKSLEKLARNGGNQELIGSTIGLMAAQSTSQ